MSEQTEGTAGRVPYGTHLARVEADYPDFSVYGKASGLYAARLRGKDGGLTGPELAAEKLDGLVAKMDAARRRMDGA